MDSGWQLWMLRAQKVSCLLEGLTVSKYNWRKLGHTVLAAYRVGPMGSHVHLLVTGVYPAP